jgi:hypothetical protein
MTHQEVQQQELAERYVRHQLAPAERRAFQEHFFACAECFEQVQTLARFVAGVRQAARQGQLAELTPQKEAWWANLVSPLLILSATAALVMALTAAWLFFRTNPASQQQLAHEPQSSPTAPGTPAPVTPQPTASATPVPPPKLEDQRDLLAQNRPPAEAPTKPPVVLLDSSRDASASSNQLILPTTATRAILRLEIEPGSGYASLECQVYDSARRLVTTASGKPSPRGMVTINLSASPLQNGKHLVKCSGVKVGQRVLVGEYDLNVRRPEQSR